MPARCVIGGCSRNSLNHRGVHFHRFPVKNATLLRQWVRFVNVTRSNFKLNASSRICSAHFHDDCTDRTQHIALQVQFGQRPVFRLKEEAVPTLKAPSSPKKKAKSPKSPRVSLSKTRSPLKRPKQSGGAFHKRERARILQEAVQEHDSVISTSMVIPMVIHSEDTAPSSPGLQSLQEAEQEIESWSEDIGPSSPEPSSMDKTSKQMTVDAQSQTITVQPDITSTLSKAPKQHYIRSKRTQTDPRRFFRSKGVQTKRVIKNTSVMTQCEVVKLPPLQLLRHLDSDHPKQPVVHEHEDDFEVEMEEGLEEESQNSEYTPSSRPSSDSDRDFSSDIDQTPAADDKKYIVFEGNLLVLFKLCPDCGGLCKRRVLRPLGGSLIEVQQSCLARSCGYTRKWRSQPLIGNCSAGNLMLAAAMLLSGCSIKKFLGSLASINMAVFSYATFFTYQRRFLQPAIVHIWNKEQAATVAAIKSSSEEAFLGMDMRADSMGFSAKFGCYSVLEMNQGKVLHIELVQKNETQNKSTLMEKEGMVRSVKWLDGKGVKIGKIVTDRHRGITKYIRENLKPRGTRHFFDIWHVAKGLKKKLAALGKIKGFHPVQEWIQGINNNIYWVAASTEGSDPDLMWAKFESVTNHIMDIHEHDNLLYPKCLHGPLTPRKWLVPGSKAAEKVAEILESPWMQKDVRMLSSSMQTSSVEAFHSVINQFAPKMFVYSYEGMLCRIYLAALHYNENAGREQTTTKDGAPAFTISYPRAKQDTGGYTVRKTLVECTYKYKQRIMNQAITFCKKGTTDARGRYKQLTRNLPPLTASVVSRPDKKVAVEQFVSRFSRSVAPVGRPEGTENIVVGETNRQKKKKEEKKQQQMQKRKKQKQKKEKAKRKKEQKEEKKKRRAEKNT